MHQSLKGSYTPAVFFRVKARTLIDCAKMLLADFGGRVPDNMDDLLKLPGVGRENGEHHPRRYLRETRGGYRYALHKDFKPPGYGRLQRSVQSRNAACGDSASRKAIRLLPYAGLSRTRGLYRALTKMCCLYIKRFMRKAPLTLRRI